MDTKQTEEEPGQSEIHPEATRIATILSMCSRF